jgi:hypothetical protein
MGIRTLGAPDFTPLEMSTETMQNTEGKLSVESADGEMFLENILGETKAVPPASNQQPSSLGRLRHTRTRLPQIEGLRSSQIYRVSKEYFVKFVALLPRLLETLPAKSNASVVILISELSSWNWER